jgi:hypothetical protein
MLVDNGASDAIKEAKKLAAGPLGVQMAKFPLRFAAAAFFGGRPSKNALVKVRNGTITLLNLGTAPIGVTCAHVIAGYRKFQDKFGEVVFYIGGVEIDPLSQLIAEDSYFDLATLKLTPEQVRDIPAGGEIGSSVFEPASWPSPALRPGEYVAFGGFPGRLRERPSFNEVVFHSWSNGANKVASVTEDRFSCQFEREYWVTTMTSEPSLDLRDMGGLSGGPAFIHRGLYWDFAGVMYQYSCEFDLMFFRPASLISRDGSIQQRSV